MNENDLAELCNNPDSVTEVSFRTSTSALPFGFIVVDENDVIVYLSLDRDIDFSTLPDAELRVYAFNFIGDITAEVGDTLGTVDLAEGCFALTSNFVTLENAGVEAGMVMTEAGETEAYTCPGDGMDDLIRFDSVGATIPQFTYIVTDENNIILAIPDGDSVNFEDAGPGVCRVWGVAFSGNFIAVVGQDASTEPLSNSCYNLSENFVTVYRETPEGGMVMTEDGQTQVNTCPGDGFDDILHFDSTGTSNSLYAYVVTDTNNVILGLPAGDSQNFEGAGAGICRVWGLAYTGNVTAMVGDTASAVALTDDCFDLSDNFITVNRDAPDAGMVMTEDGETEVFTCPGDGVADVIRFDSTDADGGIYTYVITDDNNVILALPDSDMADFEDAGSGICRVWGLAYTGNLTAMVGDTASLVALSDSCFNLSENFITVDRNGPSAGMVETENGQTEVYTCPGDGIDDIISFDSTGVSGGQFSYVVTDTNNVILSLPAGDSQNFEGAGVGICRVWGLAYTGNLTAMVGDTASLADLSDACFNLSENFITVYRDEPNGGMVMTEDGETEVYTCPGDGVADVVQFDSTGVSTSLFTYVITDTNNVILGLPPADMNDFEGAGEGICRVWGLAYTGNITAMVGDTASAVVLTDECFDLSDNFITVYREQPDGGMVMTEDGETEVYTCPGDGMADIVHFDSTGVSNSLFTYVITDTNNVILGLPPADMNDFEDAGTGVCRVWGLAYTGSITAMVGDTASAVALTDECFDLSDNFITVIRELPAGGMVMTEAGETSVSLCASDGFDDIIQFDSTGVSGGQFTYVVTDDNNVILAVPGADMANFEGAGEGICRVWGLAYNGNLIAEVGDTASVVELSDACFDLSDNFITVDRAATDGGMVMTEDGATEVYTCPGDGIDDFISFDSTGVSDDQFTYVVTDDNNVILAVPDGDMANFEDAGTGICRVWGLAYTGDLIAQAGDVASEVMLSDSCFNLSANFITVYRDEPNGGMVTTEDGETEVYTCPGDGVADVVAFDSTGVSNSLFTYVITDTSNVILGLPPADMNDFEGAGEGICRVWGLAYTGNVTAMVGDTASAVALTDECFDLSDNFITVYREQPVGGTVMTEAGETEVYTCSGDGFADVIRFDSMGVSNSLYTYVITDDNNVILGLPPADMNDFEGAGEGVCRVWGLAYTGSITAQVGDTASVVALTDDCFALSDNFVTVIRDATDGGMVMTEDGETEVFTCPGDGMEDVIRFDSTGVSDDQFTYVVTDDNNVILAVPDGDMANFEGAGVGTCRVWGLAYTGDLIAQAGDVASEVMLSDSCFNLSANFITVYRDEPNGGMVTTEDGETEVYTCPGDGVADVVAFDSTGVSNSLFTYVITDTSNVILGLPPADMNDFEGAGEGICRVWGLAYTGNVTAMVGDTASAIALTDDCFDLSDNFITVYREQPDGGMVMTEDGETEVTVTVGDGVADIVTFDSTGVSNSLFTYVITDTNAVILALPPTDMADFEDAGEGVCLVWGLAYTGNITAAVGDTASIVALTDDCFDLSDNFITVTRELSPGAQPNNPGSMLLTPQLVRVSSWPNPASTQLNVRIDSEFHTPSSLSVIDLSGRILKVRDLDLDTGEQQFQFDISDLHPGFYAIRCQHDQGVEVVRFLKQ